MSEKQAFIPISNLQGIEFARFVAAIFIVWIHVSIGVNVFVHSDAGFIGRHAVPFFALGSVFFTALGAWTSPSRSFTDFLAKRVRRICVPFVVWSGIYIALKACQGRTPTWSFSMLWTGGSYQLWYLPFIFVVSLVAFPVSCVVGKRPGVAKVAGIVAALFGLILALLPKDWGARTIGTDTADLWLDATPAAVWGFSLACIYGYGSRERWKLPWLGRGGIALAILCIVASCALVQLRLLYNVAGLCIAIASLSFSTVTQSGTRAGLARLGKLSFGIYLSHILFVGPLRSVAAGLGLSTTIPYALIATTLAATAATMLTFFMLKVRSLRWLVG